MRRFMIGASLRCYPLLNFSQKNFTRNFTLFADNKIHLYSLKRKKTDGLRVKGLNNIRGMSALTNYDYFLSTLNKKREPSAIRALMPLMKIPGMISLGGGLPNPELFPFTSMSFAVKNYSDVNPTTNITLSQQELDIALQYSATPGIPQFVDMLKTIQTTEHRPQSKDWSLSVTTGSQEALWKAFDALISDGDNVLVENPTYSGALAYLKPLNCTLRPVQTDAEGIIPADLEEVLAEPGWTKPKILYIIPTGQNPSGASSGVERKRDIYKIACKHNLIILEDDPYYYLYYGKTGESKEGQRTTIQSYWSMDTEQRVLRFDSFSKVLSSGLRIGFVTGPTKLIERIDLITQATNLHACGISQMMCFKLLQSWHATVDLKSGQNMWEKHLCQVADFYRRRRDLFMGLTKKHLLDTGLVTYNEPSAGMFLWIKLLGTTDTRALIKEKAVSAKVLLVPGQEFSPKNGESAYVRAAFSTASPEDMEQAVIRLADLLKGEKE